MTSVTPRPSACCAPTKPTLCDELEDHALPLACRQSDDERPAGRRGQSGADRGALAPTAIGGPPNRGEKRVAFAACGIELAANGLGSRKSVDAMIVVLGEPSRPPRNRGHVADRPLPA